MGINMDKLQSIRAGMSADRFKSINKFKNNSDFLKPTQLIDGDYQLRLCPIDNTKNPDGYHLVSQHKLIHAEGMEPAGMRCVKVACPACEILEMYVEKKETGFKFSELTNKAISELVPYDTLFLYLLIKADKKTFNKEVASGVYKEVFEYSPGKNWLPVIWNSTQKGLNEELLDLMATWPTINDMSGAPIIALSKRGRKYTVKFAGPNMKHSFSDEEREKWLTTTAYPKINAFGGKDNIFTTTQMEDKLRGCSWLTEIINEDVEAEDAPF